MDLKLLIIISHCIRICFTYPIDDNQGNSKVAEFSTQFSNHFPTSNANGQIVMAPEYANRLILPEPEYQLNANHHMFANFLNTMEPITYTHHKPFGIPHLPIAIPDDVKVFAPSSSSFPPPGSCPPRPQPQSPLFLPRPIPNNLQPDSNVDVFSPANDKPVPFLNRGVLASNTEILPIVFEREQLRIVPEQNSIILPKEQGQMMPTIDENELGRMPSTVIERVDRPMMVESEHLQRTPFFENQRALMVEQHHRIDPVSMMIEKEQNFHSHMIPSTENERVMVESEQPKVPMPIIMEKEVHFERPIESLQMAHFTDNERVKGLEERTPATEFVPIPWQLPERIKRDKNSINSNYFETAGSSLTVSKEELINELDRQSIVDNEVMQTEGTSNISFNTINEKIKLENMPPESTKSLKIESNDKPSTKTNVTGSKILEINHGTFILTIDEHTEREQLSTEHTPIISQPLNVEGNEKTTKSTTIIDGKEGNENNNYSAPVDEAINHKGLSDAIQLTTSADKISTASIPVESSQQTSTTKVSKVIAEKFLPNFLSKNNTVANQDTSDYTHSVNFTDHLENEKPFNFSISIVSPNEHPIHSIPPVVESETTPQVQTSTNVHQFVVDLAPINKHQLLSLVLPAVSYIPFYPSQETQNYGSPLGNINQNNNDLYALSQLYPLGHFNHYKSKF